jgi:hypothetical protein
MKEQGGNNMTTETEVKDCESCYGSGHVSDTDEPGSGHHTCGDCGGKGEYTVKTKVKHTEKWTVDGNLIRATIDGSIYAIGKMNSCDQAEDVVREHNSHEALLEAAKYVRDRMFVAGVGNQLPQGTISKHCFDFLNKAISQAESKGEGR